MARHFNNRRSTLNVDEEYSKALRTKSFIEICTKAHQQLKRTNCSSSSSEEDEKEKLTSPLSHLNYSHLPHFLLEPVQEPVVSSTAGRFRLQALLLDYFDTTLQAFFACASLLASIDCVRSHLSCLRRCLLSLYHSSTSSSVAELAALLELDNPLSPRNICSFNRTHALLSPLIHRLTSAHRRIIRRIRLIRMSKNASGLALVAACCTAVGAALTAATHAAATIGAVPVVLVRPRAAAEWLRRRTRVMFSDEWLESSSMRLDAAAKGAYIVARDFDTMSRMVRRADGEVERLRDMGRMVLRNPERHLVREVVRDVKEGEAGFVEQLGELEEHVYLCLLTINRSRRLVAQEMGCMAAATAPMP